MKVSFEVPIKYLYDFDQYQDYIFILPHLCKDPTYKQYCLLSNKMKIMDNSVYELSKPLPPEELFDLVAELKVDVIVVPDVLFDIEETLRVTDEFYNKLAKTSLKVKTMIVPQGADQSEYYMCLNKMRGYPFDYIGVCFLSKGYGPKECEEIRYQKILSIVRGYPDKKIHLLGLNYIFYLEEYKKFLNIESIDTSFPVSLAYYKQKIDRFSIRRGRPQNFFDLVFDHEQYRIAKENIEIFRNFAK